MKIYFKTKSTVDVSEEVALVINKALEDKKTQWQSFFNANGKLFLTINLTEIEFIA